MPKPEDRSRLRRIGAAIALASQLILCGALVWIALNDFQLFGRRIGAQTILVLGVASGLGPLALRKIQSAGGTWPQRATLPALRKVLRALSDDDWRILEAIEARSGIDLQDLPRHGFRPGDLARCQALEDAGLLERRGQRICIAVTVAHLRREAGGATLRNLIRARLLKAS